MTGRHADRHADRHTDRQTDRQTDSIVQRAAAVYRGTVLVSGGQREHEPVNMEPAGFHEGGAEISRRR